jgi:hypothetical protein
MKPTPESIRSSAARDPNTARIATNLGMALDEYLDLIVHYATKPAAEQQLFTVPDDALRDAGHDVPQPADVVRFFHERKVIDSAVNGTGFDPPRAKGPALR